MDPVALRLRVGEQHPQDVRRHQHQHEHRYDFYRHVLLLPPGAVFDPNRSAGFCRDDQPPPHAPVGLIPAA